MYIFFLKILAFYKSYLSCMWMCAITAYLSHSFRTVFSKLIMIVSELKFHSHCFQHSVRSSNSWYLSINHSFLPYIPFNSNPKITHTSCCLHLTRQQKACWIVVSHMAIRWMMCMPIHQLLVFKILQFAKRVERETFKQFLIISASILTHFCHLFSVMIYFKFKVTLLWTFMSRNLTLLFCLFQKIDITFPTVFNTF